MPSDLGGWRREYDLSNHCAGQVNKYDLTGTFYPLIPFEERIISLSCVDIMHALCLMRAARSAARWGYAVRIASFTSSRVSIV